MAPPRLGGRLKQQRLLSVIFGAILDTLEILEKTDSSHTLPNFWRAFQDVWKSRAVGTPWLTTIRAFCQQWVTKIHGKEFDKPATESPLDALLNFFVDLSEHLSLVSHSVNVTASGPQPQGPSGELSPAAKRRRTDDVRLWVDWPTSMAVKRRKDLAVADFQDNFDHWVAQHHQLPADPKNALDLVQIVLFFDGTRQDRRAGGTDLPERGDEEFRQLLVDLQKEDWYKNQMQVYREEPKRREVCRITREAELHDAVKAACLVVSGSLELYIHQSKALDFLLQGSDVCVSTSTASGKSLIFMSYAAHRLLRSGEETVLVVYPTKALAQDQFGKWTEFFGNVAKNSPSVADIKIRVIDGDTTFKDRLTYANEASIVLTNFDYCHKTILSNANQYLRILKNLRFFVVDEAHMYRGVFGAHSAMCLRRILMMHDALQKWSRKPEEIIAEREAQKEELSEADLGAHLDESDWEDSHAALDVQVITCTATLGNPREHFQLLTGRSDVRSVAEDGSPSAPKYFVLWDPPAVEKGGLDSNLIIRREDVDAAASSTTNFDQIGEIIISKDTMTEKLREEFNMIKLSAINESIRLFLFMMRRNIKTFLFCNARSLVEIIYRVVQSKLSKERHLASRVVSYRGGYTADTRRLLERKIFRNEAYGVISTNALEIGIDLGLLDVVLTLGFEGSVSSVKQRLGRAGRSQRPSLGMMIAFDGPVERYIVRQLGIAFWKKRPEPVALDPANVILVKQHLVCALKELGRPVDAEMLKRFLGPAAEAALAVGEKTGELRQAENREYKFCVTSRRLIVSDGEERKALQDVQLQRIRKQLRLVDEPYSDHITAEDRQRPISELPSEKLVEVLPFLDPQHKETAADDINKPGYVSDAFLTQLFSTSPDKTQSQGNEEEEERPMLFINDVSQMKDYNKFVDPHSIVELRATGVPNVNLYLMGSDGALPTFQPQNAGGFIKDHGDVPDEVRGLQLIDETTLELAFMHMFPGAIYLLRGREILVNVFNYHQRYAIGTLERNLDYETKCSDRHAYIVLDVEAKAALRILTEKVAVYLGNLRLVWEFPFYWKIPKSQGPKKKITKVQLDLPDLGYDTRGVTVDFSDSALLTEFFRKAEPLLLQKSMEASFKSSSRGSPRDSLLTAGLHGLSHALCRAAQTVIWCDAHELIPGCPSPDAAYQRQRPRLHVYEKPAALGLGLADILFRNDNSKLEELLLATYRMLHNCTCNVDPDLAGCLDCVLWPYCVEQNRCCNSKAAMTLLDLIVDPSMAGATS